MTELSAGSAIKPQSHSDSSIYYKHTTLSQCINITDLSDCQLLAITDQQNRVTAETLTFRNQLIKF